MSKPTQLETASVPDRIGFFLLLWIGSVIHLVLLHLVVAQDFLRSWGVAANLVSATALSENSGERFTLPRRGV